jgi:PiT family inorganic phosphate transporter
MAPPVITPPGSLLDEKLKKTSPGNIGGIIFAVMLVGGLIYIGIKLASDLSIVHSVSVLPFILLGVTLLIALGFEFAGVLRSSGTVAFTIITLLPVELILKVSKGARFRWSSLCWSRRFCGTLRRGGVACRPPVRTP